MNIAKELLDKKEEIEELTEKISALSHEVKPIFYKYSPDVVLAFNLTMYLGVCIESDISAEDAARTMLKGYRKLKEFMEEK